MRQQGDLATATSRVGAALLLLSAPLLWPNLVVAQSVQAGEAPLRVNGYATLGLIHSSESRADYIPNPLRVYGAGRSENPSAVTDSLAALQIDYQVNPQLSATVQAVVEQGYRKGVRPRLEWANLQYRLSDTLDVRLGRIALDSLMVSGYRKVGYATPWARPPAELYQLMAITNSDGVDLSYRLHHAGSHYSSQLVYGRNQMTETRGDLSVPNLWGSFNRLERGPLTLQASYLATKVEFGIAEEFWAAYRAFGPAGEAVADSYDTAEKWAPYLSFGAAWDAGAWFMQGEWGQGDTRSGFGRRTGWYLSAGQRHGDWTPYLSYARAQGSERDVRGLDASEFPAPLRPTLDALNNTLFLLQSATAPHQQSISAGLRWDLHARSSITAQYDRVRTRKGSIGLFRNLENPGYRPTGAEVFSLNVDFLF